MPSDLEALRNLGKKPLTEREVMIGFFMSLGGIVGGLVFMFWAVTGVSTMNPANVDSARIIILCSGSAFMGVGSLSLSMLTRDVRRIAKR